MGVICRKRAQAGLKLAVFTFSGIAHMITTLLVPLFLVIGLEQFINCIYVVKYMRVVFDSHNFENAYNLNILLYSSVDHYFMRHNNNKHLMS